MPHALDGLTVFDPDGREIRLEQLWAERTAVLVFVRHFGCLFCRQQLAEMAPLRDRIRSLGAELFVIGHGTIEETRAFRAAHAAGLPVFTDPARQAYRALGMRHGRRSVLSLRVLLRSLKALRQGFRQTGVAGDAFQQGGVVAIAPGGQEVYRYISRDAGDHPRPDAILAALKSTPPAA